VGRIGFVVVGGVGFFKGEDVHFFAGSIGCICLDDARYLRGGVRQLNLKRFQVIEPLQYHH
jgi:hypothetical protein